jgi:hypothetical protein
MKRPFIVTFNALLNLFLGLIFTFINLYFVACSNPHGVGGCTSDVTLWDPLIILTYSPLTALSVGSIFVFFGLWRLRRWGRTLFNLINIVIGLFFISLAVTGYGIDHAKARWILAAVSMIFFLAPLGMAKPAIKEAFRA